MRPSPRKTSSSGMDDCTERQPCALPDEIVLKVMRKLDQQNLLRLCTVSRSWQGMSYIALHKLEVEITSRTKAKAKGLASWLEKRGHALLDLHIHALQSTVLELAFPAHPKLQMLTIEQARLPHTNRISMLKGLTCLQLVRVHASQQLLGNLAALTNLRSLCLDNVDFGPLITAAGRRTIAERCSGMLTALQQLRELTLRHCDLDNTAVQQITSLQHLQALDLSGNQLQGPAAAAAAAAATLGSNLPALPSTLTLLNLSNNHMHLEVTPVLENNTLPQLQQLSISSLTLKQSPGCLATLTGLTRLEAAFVTLAEGYELVSAIQQLQMLQHLQLQGTFADAARPDTAALEQCLAQLTLLTHLNLSDNRLLPLPAPAGAAAPPPAPALLSTTRYPQLQELQLSCTELPRGHGPNFRYDGKGLQQLLANCPRLVALDLSGRIHHNCTDRDLLPLTGLTGLSSLVLGGKGWLLNDAMFKVLAQLTGLQSLEVVEGCDVSDGGLLALTQLTNLTLLLLADCYGDDVSEAVVPLPRYEDAPRELCLLQKGSGRAGTVWQQLLTRCNNSPACLKLRQKQLEKELQAAKKEAAQERKRATTAEKRAHAAQQEVQELRQLLQSLRAATAAERPNGNSIREC